jgi:peptidoglycan/xylan/chitin deacetylase (PgdA/CDA1 family)
MKHYSLKSGGEVALTVYILLTFFIGVSFVGCGTIPSEDVIKPSNATSQIAKIDSTHIKDSIAKIDTLRNKNAPFVVIIKADDFWYLTPSWKKFIDIITRQNICASIGVIGKRIPSTVKLKDTLTSIVNLKQSNGSPVIEFWNHGYDHTHYDGDDYEFFRDFNTQLLHIKLNQDILFSTTGQTCHTFSTPFNRSNLNTKLALDKIDEINVVMRYPQIENYKFTGSVNPDSNFVRRTDKRMYLDIGYLSLDHFDDKDALDTITSLKSKKYFVIQIHPTAWEDETEFNQFERFIGVLKTKNIIFMTPYQYYNYFHK